MPVNVGGYNIVSEMEAYFSGVITEGLILYLDAGTDISYPGTGTTWYDLTNNGNNGTLTNGPTYSSTSGSGSIIFDGVNDYVTTGNQLDPIAYGLFADASSRFSVSSWFLPDTTNATNGAITGKGGGLGSSATYVVYEGGTSLIARLRGGTVLTITSGLTSTWNEVVITWDGTTANAYLNGSFVNTISVGTAANQTNNFTIGATGGGAVAFYKGNIADTKVYNRALTSTEVTQNYNVLKGRFGL